MSELKEGGRQLRKKEEASTAALGEYLRRLREDRDVSLHEIERKTGISNAYLSLLERGKKQHLPPAEVLGKLADYFNVTTQQLLEKAGYLDTDEVGETLEQKIEKAFRHVISDPQFKYGTRLRGSYDLAAKRFIVEMYEASTNRKVLTV